MTNDQDLMKAIADRIAASSVLLFMKGEPESPMCGFSARAVSILKALGVSFESVNVLSEPEVRRLLPQVSQWPTFPQLFIRGDLVGGSDIMFELYESGELSQMLEQSKTY